MFVEDTGRSHYSVEQYKKITNYENTKKVLNNIKLELPEVPSLNDISKISIKRDNRIMEEIIKPKDSLIKELYEENISLHKELSKQDKVVDEAVKYQKERDKILADNKALQNEVKNMRNEYKEKQFDLEWKYKSKIEKLEYENTHLAKIINKFYENIKRFIHWICNKFSVSEEDSLIRDFEKETNTYLDPQKQIQFEKELEYEDDMEF